MSVKLYTFFRSSAAYRVRIALNLKGVAYESIPIHFRRDSGQHRSDDFLRLNPQGLLPVLEHDGVVLTQSLAIVDYLDARFPEPALMPAQPVARAHALAMAQLIASEIHPLNNLRVLTYLRAELELDEAAVERWYRHWVAESFAPLERLLARHSAGRFCYGDTVSVADVCLVPQVYNAQRFGCDLAPYPRLAAVAAGLNEMDAFARAAPERQPDAE